MFKKVMSYESPESTQIVHYIADRAIQQNIASDELVIRLTGLFSPDFVESAVSVVRTLEKHCDRMYDDILNGFISVFEASDNLKRGL